LDESAAYDIARMSKVITEADVEVEGEVKSKRTKKVKNVEKVEKPEKQKTVKTKVDKYNGFKVPDKNIRSTKWGIYLYDIIKEAKPALLQREDVRNEYNNLITCLRKYDGFIESSIPSKYYKYNRGIDIISEVVSGLLYPFRISDNAYNNPQRNVHSEKKTEFITELKQVYAPLYELIKRDIIPYMELKQHEITSKFQIERYHYKMEKVEKTIKAYESRIADLYKELGELSEEVMKCKEPPKLTVFE
jgi:hypothetical protein